MKRQSRLNNFRVKAKEENILLRSGEIVHRVKTRFGSQHLCRKLSTAMLSESPAVGEEEEEDPVGLLASMSS